MKPTNQPYTRFLTLLLVASLPLLVASLPLLASAQDWPAIRGADGLGSATTDGILSKSKDVALEVRWKKEIGSGYSSVVVAADDVVTMYADDQDDVVACLSAKDGAEKWKTSIGPTFVGKNGSFDGPLSTPVIHNGFVYALSATGRFLAIDIKDGSVLWSREMVKEESAPLPLYGFTTSPIIAGGNVILQLGAKNKAIAAFDPKTGQTVWSTGNDEINSQTPILVEAFGKQLLIAAGGKQLMGVDPTDGKIVFEYEHKGGNGSAMIPVPIGNNQFLLTLDDRFSTAVELRPLDNALHASEAWQQRSIKNTYNVPALCDGNLYAYSTRIFTCVDPKTGKPRWKNRNPGDGFLIAIDDHLIINTKNGGLHLARANQEKYDEIVKLKLFKDLVWSIPAYSDNAVFCRSLGEIARVDIVPTTDATAIVDNTDLPTGPQFTKFLDAVDDAKTTDERTGIIEAFFDKQKSFPIIEGDIVCFVYHGPGPDVAVASDVFGARQERKMKPVKGTDLFYYSMKLPLDQRANYCFLVDYKTQLDDLNPRAMTSSVYAGEMEFAVRLASEPPLKMSWFSMPNWKQPPFLVAQDTPLAGKVISQTIPASDNSTEIKFDVYLPPNYSTETDHRYPVAYIFGGKAAREQGGFVSAVDQIFQSAESKQPPCIIVFLDGVGPRFPTRAVKEIVPFVDKTFRTQPDREARLAVGFGFNAASAMMVAAGNPDVFGKLSAQSPLLFAAAKEALIPMFAKVEQPLEVYLDWGRFDMYNPHENWDVRSTAAAVAKTIAKNPNVTVVGGQVNDSTDWSSWRNRYDKILALLK